MSTTEILKKLLDEICSDSNDGDHTRQQVQNHLSELATAIQNGEPLPEFEREEEKLADDWFVVRYTPLE